MTMRHGAASAPVLPMLGTRGSSAPSSSQKSTAAPAPAEDNGAGVGGFGSIAASKPVRHRRKQPPMLSISDNSTVPRSAKDDGLGELGGFSQGSPSMKRSGSKRSGSMGAVVSWMRRSMSGVNTPGGRGSSKDRRSSTRSSTRESRRSITEVHKNDYRVVTARSPTAHRSIPLAKAPGNFESIGDFVKYHREGRDRLIREGYDPALEEEEEDSNAEEDSTVDKLPEVKGVVAEEEDDSIPNWDPESALWELRNAAKTNNYDHIRRLLLVAGQDVRLCLAYGDTASWLDSRDDDGDTAALIAARTGSSASCAALLDAGADPLARDKHSNYFGDGVWPDERATRPDFQGKAIAPAPGAEKGRSVVYYLRQQGCLDECLAQAFPMTRFSLVRAVAGYLQNFHEKTALVIAANHGCPELAALLLRHSAAMVGLPPADGITNGSGERGIALLAAVSQRQFRVAEVLLAGSVPRSALDGTRDKRGRTSLHVAVMLNELKLTSLLLEAGASTSVYNIAGKQPLHDACYSGHMGVARLLVEAGANLFAVTLAGMGPPGSSFGTGGAGRTPHDVASGRGHSSLAAFLHQRATGAPAALEVN